MLDKLSQYFQGSVMEVLDTAAFLDPRFKSLLFMSSDERDDTARRVEIELTMRIPSTAANEDTPVSEPSPKSSRGEDRLLHLLSDVIQTTMEQSVNLQPAELAKQEVTKYLAEDLVQEDPLMWWSQHQLRYPHLTCLAKKYLAIPATSVPAERAFSIAGHIVNERRACLLPESVRMLAFLAENLS